MCAHTHNPRPTHTVSAATSSGGDVLFESSSLCAALLDTVKRCSSLSASDGPITPDNDLAEFVTTLRFVKALVTPLLAAGPIVDPAAEICMRGMRDTLDTLTRFFAEHILGPRVRITMDSWHNKRIYLYQVRRGASSRAAPLCACALASLGSARCSGRCSCRCALEMCCCCV